MHIFMKHSLYLLITSIGCGIVLSSCQSRVKNSSFSNDTDTVNTIMESVDVCVDGLFCGKAFILVPFGYHAKDIKPGSFLGWDVNILILELPAIWNITICTDMAFVGII